VTPVIKATLPLIRPESSRRPANHIAAAARTSTKPQRHIFAASFDRWEQGYGSSDPYRHAAVAIASATMPPV
jgi:hypothetical protein